MRTLKFFIPGLVLLLYAVGFVPPATAGPQEAVKLHAEYGHLLARYVHGTGVDYAAWVADAKDHAALGAYVDTLARLDPSTWPRDDALAFWLDMYNAVTVRLILDNYPLDSIKDLGGILKKSPWKRKLVTVAGRELTLNNIENDIIRPTFQDPRIHFALNCASVGCPPLRAGAYLPDSLSVQLDEACRRVLNLDHWVRIDGDKVALTKIFDWYKSDFEAAGGTVETFINRYRHDPVSLGTGVSYIDYDWSLNRTR